MAALSIHTATDLSHSEGMVGQPLNIPTEGLTGVLVARMAQLRAQVAIRPLKDPQHQDSTEQA